MFEVVPELKIGDVLEVEGTSVRIELSGELDELTKTYGGHVYDVGQVGSLIKIHHGRRILLAYVRMLRMKYEEEDEEDSFRVTTSEDARLLEGDLFGEGIWRRTEDRFLFHRGVKTYPLPGQHAYLATRRELREVYEGAQRSHAEASDDEEVSLVKVGNYFGTEAADCRLDVDRLFSHHCAVLGATGTGKSATVASLIHSILDYETDEGDALRPRIVLIDPHGEYVDAFGDRAVVYRAYDTPGGDEVEADQLHLPYWLMNGEEFRDLVIGKTEYEATSENNIVRKALEHARLVERGWIEPAQEWEGRDTDATEVDHPEDPRPVDEEYEPLIGGYNRDTPDPFSLNEFERHIRLEQAMRIKSGSWERESPSNYRSYQSVLDKLSVLRSDPRLQFMMKDYNEADPELSDIVSQFVGEVDADQESGQDIRIIDISGLPNEVAGPLTAAVARLLFEYKTWQRRNERERDPVLFVCEEAHRYVPDRGQAEYEAAQSAVRRLAKEGRKYGIGLMLVSQRPADVEQTVLSQCNSWVVLRLTNPSDQQFVKRFLPDSFSGLAGLLSVLGRREAIVVGSAAALPARVMVRRLEDEQLPASRDVSFIEGWGQDPLSGESIESITNRWKNSAFEVDGEIGGGEA